MTGSTIAVSDDRIDRATTTDPLEFSGVTKRFGARTVLDGLTFSVPRGHVVGLLGPNGAGKSTAMRILLGLQKPTAGEVRILGERPGTSGFRRAVRRVGAIIEAPPLYKNATAMENLEIRVAALGLSTKDAKVREILGTVNLAERADDKVGSFSLGMRQRVGIALALVGDPEIVVLDEPTNGLDPEGAVEIRTLVRDLPQRGTTALLCTHRLDEVEKSCDYVVVLKEGRLITQGALADVVASVGESGVSVLVRPEETSAAARILESFGLTDVTTSAGGRVSGKGSVGDLSAVNRALVDQRIYLAGLGRSEATLEQAFLDLTTTAEGARR